MQNASQNGPLNFIGTGSAFNHNLGNNSAYIKRNSTFLLIDCGGTVFHRIQELNLLQDVQNLYVIVTHMHPDHVGSLGDLIFYTYYILNFKTTVIYPDINTLVNLLTALGVTKEFYNIKQIDKNVFLKNSDIELNIEYVSQQHTDTLKSYGYNLGIDGIKLFYSGDSSSIPDTVLQKLSVNDINLIFQDTCSYDFPNIPHMSLNKLAQCIQPNLRHKVYCMHLDNSFNIDTALSLGFNIAQIQ